MTDWDADATLTADTRVFSQSQWQLPEVPNNKFVYELDNTSIVFYLDGNIQTTLAHDAVTRMNSYWSATGGSDYGTSGHTLRYLFVFAEPRDITHIACATTLGTGRTLTAEWSPDTTDGSDGTWNTITGLTLKNLPVAEDIWRQPLATSATNAIAVRFQWATSSSSAGRYFACHMYGDRSAPVRRLALWEPLADAEVDKGFFDWGLLEPGTTTQRQFRVKNMSISERAVTVSAITDSVDDPWSPTYASMHTLSYDGGAFASSVDIGSLDVGAISELITLKAVMPYGLDGRSWSLRLGAEADSWFEYVWFSDVSDSVVAELTAVLARVQDTSASLVASTAITDGALYRSAELYRNSYLYRGSKTNIIWDGTASLVASVNHDAYQSEFFDSYGGQSLFSEGTSTAVEAEAAIVAVATGDTYFDEYVDTYGCSGLSAEAEVISP